MKNNGMMKPPRNPVTTPTAAEHSLAMAATTRVPTTTR